jgi:hypothetical protein
MSLEAHIDWQGQPHLVGRLVRLAEARRFLLSIDYVLALDDVACGGSLHFRLNSESPFLAAATGKLPPLVRLKSLIESGWPVEFDCRVERR